MRVVILAAGKGSRLGMQDLPKPLTTLANGRSILGYQIYHLQKYISLDRVVLVVGYHKEMLMEKFAELLFVYNPQYATENTSKSLLRAIAKFDEDILWINGDVVFHPEVIGQILAEKRSSMVVNAASVGEEEVKYRTRAGKIIEVSKYVSHPEGEALGINYIAQKDLQSFSQELDRCQPSDYFEKGLEMCIHKGLDVYPVQVDASLCAEVDFPEDLVRANALVQQWD